jgi:hypothetical protein
MPPKSAAPRPPSKTRYFKGKPGGAVADSDSEGDDADDTLNLKLVAQRGPAAAAAAAANADPSLVAGGAGRVITPGSLKDVKPRIKMDLASVVIPDGGVSKREFKRAGERIRRGRGDVWNAVYDVLTPSYRRRGIVRRRERRGGGQTCFRAQTRFERV